MTFADEALRWLTEFEWYSHFKVADNYVKTLGHSVHLSTWLTEEKNYALIALQCADHWLMVWGMAKDVTSVG